MKMHKLSFFAECYYDEKGAWPDESTWETQLAPLLSLDRNWGPTNILIDSWGNKIRYQVRSENGITRRTLHSDGPNKIDDHDGGDDIVVLIKD